MDVEKAAKRMSRTIIGKHGLVEDAVNLRLAGMTLVEIQSTLNSKLPADKQITLETVRTFYKRLPELKQTIVKNNKKQLVRAVNNNLDMVSELNDLYGRTKTLLDRLEDRAEDEDYIMNPFRFKAISSEMRELLRLMMEVNKEISDLDNINRFMAIVVEVIKEESPQSIPIIVERLRTAKGTGWLSEVIRKAGN